MPGHGGAQDTFYAADLLKDRVVPFYDEHDIRLSRVLTDRGTEYGGSPERHEYELYLAVEDIDHTRTKTKSPQTNGICERFHRTVLDEFYRVAFRKRSTPPSTRCSPTLICGSQNTTSKDRIRAGGATARPRSRLSSTRSP